jgi:hypothetical protein
MPASPHGLNFSAASAEYLQSLTAYFVPTVSTQIANVMCKRSWKNSLFARDFLSPARRRDCLKAIAAWRPLPIGAAPRPRHRWRAMVRLSRFLDKHFILLNFVANPLIDLGILFELLLCYFFFYTPLARVYYFAPVPLHVYLFALHGTVLLLGFEETKKYCRRRGRKLEWLG